MLTIKITIIDIQESDPEGLLELGKIILTDTPLQVNENLIM